MPSQAFARDRASSPSAGRTSPVPGDGLVADAVAMAPGNPSHVLLDDRVAEHIPGCNSLFRRDALLDDRRLRPALSHVAGDDVDVCWRLQDAGGTIALRAAAVVLHHRRGSLPGYLRQQRGYGRAEAKLERKWPERYSAERPHHVGRADLRAGIDAARPAATGRWRVYHGSWNSAPFQRLYEPCDGGRMNTVLLMPEAYLAIGCLTLLVALGADVARRCCALAPLLLLAAGLIAIRAVTIAARAPLPTRGPDDAPSAPPAAALAALLHLLQPLFRLDGRLRHGLTPWRRRPHHARVAAGRPRGRALARALADPYDDLRALRDRLTGLGAGVRLGGDFDAWDLEVAGGTLGGARITTLVEEHERGRRMIRTRCRPTTAPPALAVIARRGGAGGRGRGRAARSSRRRSCWRAAASIGRADARRGGIGGRDRARGRRRATAGAAGMSAIAAPAPPRRRLVAAPAAPAALRAPALARAARPDRDDAREHRAGPAAAVAAEARHRQRARRRRRSRAILASLPGVDGPRGLLAWVADRDGPDLPARHRDADGLHVLLAAASASA